MERDSKLSQTCPIDMSDVNFDEEIKKKVREREEKDREQRKIEGKYCLLERVEGDQERIEACERNSLYDEKINDSGKQMDSVLDSTIDTTAAVVESEIDTKSDILVSAPIQTDSLAEPYNKQMVNSSPLVGSVQSYLSVRDESVVSDVKADSDNGEEEWLDDSSSSSYESDVDDRTETREVTPRTAYIVSTKGARFDHNVKRQIGNDFNDFELPSCIGAEFQIVYEHGHFNAKSLKSSTGFMIARHKHVLRDGDCVEFEGENRVWFGEVQRLGGRATGHPSAMRISYVVHSGGTAMTEGTVDVLLAAGSSLATIGFGKQHAIDLSKPKTTPSTIKTIARLIPEAEESRVVIEGEGEGIFKVCLRCKDKDGDGDSKATGGSVDTNTVITPRGSPGDCLAECVLATGDILDFGGKGGARYKVTLCAEPRCEDPFARIDWKCVRRCCGQEDGNFAVNAYNEDRIVARDALCGAPSDGVFAVFDGHNGHWVSDLAATVCPTLLEEELFKTQMATPRSPRSSRSPSTIGRLSGSETKIMTEPSSDGVGEEKPRDGPKKGRTLSQTNELSELRTLFSKGNESVRAARLKESGAVQEIKYFEVNEVRASGPTSVLKRVCNRINRLIRGLPGDKGMYSGSTGQICMLYKDKKSGDTTLHTASLGDSGAILIRDGKPVEVSAVDRHKWSHEKEAARLKENAIDNGRFMGLAVSRAFGDLSLEEYLLHDPIFSETKIGQRDTHLVVASDGIWDNIKPRKLVNIVLSSRSSADAVKKIIHHALTQPIKNTKDNISLVIAELHNPVNHFNKISVQTSTSRSERFHTPLIPTIEEGSSEKKNGYGE